MLKSKPELHHDEKLAALESLPPLTEVSPDSSPNFGPVTYTIEPQIIKRAKIGDANEKAKEEAGMASLQLEAIKHPQPSQNNNFIGESYSLSPSLSFYPQYRKQYTASCDSTDSGPSPYRAQYKAG